MPGDLSRRRLFGLLAGAAAAPMVAPALSYQGVVLEYGWVGTNDMRGFPPPDPKIAALLRRRLNEAVEEAIIQGRAYLYGELGQVPELLQWPEVENDLPYPAR